jgi:glycosyltransferase involved in cell wall biosynthesis
VLFSVCIPAYNRAPLLGALLDSILAQDFDDYEVLICEDASRERPEIRAIVQRYASRFPDRIRYLENETNLGYDANLRRLMELARGNYCFFMGNDDLMCPHALAAVAAALRRHDNVGVIVRSYQSFDGAPANIVQTFRYFPDERFFAAGPDAVVTAFRRSVVIPGMVIHSEAARAVASAEFDGTLLYQLHVVANVLFDMNALFVPQILVLYRNGGVPDFGNSPAERGKFVPQEQTVQSSLEFMRGMLRIAASAEQRGGAPIYRRIVRDIANYSYPILAIQRSRPIGSFVRYWWRLARLGFGRNGLFHLYFAALLLLGTRRTDALINFIKNRMGHTPVLGSISRGSKV